MYRKGFRLLPHGFCCPMAPTAIPVPAISTTYVCNESSKLYLIPGTGIGTCTQSSQSRSRVVVESRGVIISLCAAMAMT